jgi:hypothetical protein
MEPPARTAAKVRFWLRTLLQDWTNLRFRRLAENDPAWVEACRREGAIRDLLRRTQRVSACGTKTDYLADGNAQDLQRSTFDPAARTDVGGTSSTLVSPTMRARRRRCSPLAASASLRGACATG